MYSLTPCVRVRDLLFFRFSPYEWQIEESMSGTTVILFEGSFVPRLLIYALGRRIKKQIFYIFMPWEAGEQPLQRDQQPLVRAGSVHAAGNRHHPKIHLRQDCWWVLTDLSITWMYVKRDVNVAIHFARRKEQLRYQTKLESIDLKATILQCPAKTFTKM